MKKLYALCSLLATAASLHAQQPLPINTDMHFKFSRPMGASGLTLNDAFGVGMNISAAPTRCPNFSIGITGSISGYGSKSEKIKIETQDGDEIETTSTISNSILGAGLFAKYYFFDTESRMNIFIDAKAGPAFFNTRFYIEDPNDIDNCEPLENLLLHKDKTISGYAGGGMELRLDGLFNSLNAMPSSPVYFTLSGGYNLGGRVSYMNVNSPECETPGGTSHQPQSSPYYARFRNNQTQNIHSHRVGTIYTSQLKMLELNAGVSFKF